MRLRRCKVVQRKRAPGPVFPTFCSGGESSYGRCLGSYDAHEARGSARVYCESCPLWPSIGDRAAARQDNAGHGIDGHP